MDSSMSSFSFHSVANSFTESKNSDTKIPLLSQIEKAHLADSPFSDPPLLPSTTPSFRHSIKQSPSIPSSPSISPKSGVSEDVCTIYSRGSGFGSARCLDLDSLHLSHRIRSCDVFIGALGRSRLMVRFVKWLREELERQGVLCFVVDRSRCISVYDHRISKAAMDVATYGVVMITKRSLANLYTIEEIRVFLEKKRLIPIFFELSKLDCSSRDIVERRGELWERYGGRLWESYGGLESDWKEAVNGISRLNLELEANSNTFRDCIAKTIIMIGTGLGRSKVVESVKSWKRMETEEIPFRRNPKFVGRDKELLDLERMLFGDVEDQKDASDESRTRRRHRREELAMSGRIEKESAERRKKGKEPMASEESAKQIESEMNESISGRMTPKLKHGKGIACVTGESGIGKTELLLEYAYCYSQRYKMILWVGGESKYFRQNYMKLLPLVGIDTDLEDKLFLERSQQQYLEDIEEEAIRKVRKELMRDIPYLLIIDSLEREKDWWDGKNLAEFLPYFGEATHVLISTSLPRVMNIEPMRLLYLSLAGGTLLMKGSETNLETEEADSLRLIEEKAGRLPFGLALVGTVLFNFL